MQGTRGTSAARPGGTSEAAAASGPAATHDARVLRAVLAVPRVLRLYPPGHQRVEHQLDELAGVLALRFAGNREAVDFVVRGGHLEIDGVAPECSPELAAELALKLRRRRVRVLSIRSGVERWELQRVGEMIALDHKELLRAGGPADFLAPEGGPAAGRIQVQVFHAGGGEAHGPSRVAVFVAQSFDANETIERLDRIRATLTENAADEATAAEAQVELEDVLHEFLSRPEWESLSEADTARAIHSFLDLLEHTLAGRAEDTYRERIDRLRSFFRGLEPGDLVRGAAHRAADGMLEAGTTADRGAEDPATPDAAVQRAVDAHCHEGNALLVLCDLMVTARNETQYRERRGLFLTALSTRRWSSPALARLLRHLVIEMRPVGFETNESLVQAAFSKTDDEEALVLFLASLSDRQDLARPVLAQLVCRANPFPLLARLLRAPLLDSFRPVLTDRLVATARARQEALSRWALRNRAEFFRPEIFAPLFRRGTELVGPIAKEILAKGPERDRAELVARLRRDGSGKALRILVLGMPFGGGSCDHELVRALGAFDHPLAVGALREVVHRANTGDLRSAEAGTALHALSRMTREDGLAFLHEVAAKRRLGMPVFRNELRKLAAGILAEFAR